MGKHSIRQRWIGAAAALLISLQSFGQPKLVVQVVVDQMRADYLMRFNNQFSSDGGFRTLLDEGMHFRNTHYNYIPTYTGPGHATVLPGLRQNITESLLMIGGWKSMSSMYCAEDADVNPIGTLESSSSVLPKTWSHWLLQTVLSCIPTTLKFSGELKDRGAIFPAGHFANGALARQQMHFVTSSYYRNELPKYVEKYNKKEWAIKLAKKDWN